MSSTTNNTVQAIIFDLGRVLVDLDLTRGFLAMLCAAEAAEPADTLLPRLLREAQFRAYNMGQLTPEEFHMAVCERFSLSLSFAEFKQKWCDIFRPMPGMEDMFTALAERYTIGILSDCDPLHWAYLRERFSFLQRVERPSLSFEIGSMKPAPEMYQHAAKMAGVSAANCFFTDDLQDNIDGARAVGMMAVHFSGADSLRQVLHDRGLL